MLKGFMAPRSPLGAAALVPSPPWHFAGDVLAVEFWNDPDISVDSLPTGVELDKEYPGHSVALFTDYQFTAQNDEYLDPARYQCRGFSVLLDATWKGLRIAWCPYCYVDNDAALMRGWIQGYPGKFGTIHQTRTFAAASAASAPLAPDSRFGASMSAHGRLLVQARVTLREKASVLSACSIAGLRDGDIFRGSPRACTTSRPWMNLFGASQTASWSQTSGSARGSSVFQRLLAKSWKCWGR